MEFTWQHPHYLWIGPALFVAVLLSAVLFHRWRRRIWRILGLSTQGTVLSEAPMGTARFFTRYTLLGLALLFLGLALANLQMGTQTQTVERQGSDVVFVLDASLSMLAEDIAPNRLEKAKMLISRSIDALGGDRVGIIAYAGSPYPALPITTDYAAAKMALNSLSPSQMPSQGTNLAAALDYAFDYFSPESPAGRTIVVLTDGEDHEGLGAGILPDFAVNTLLVGLGTSKGGPIPVRKMSTGVQYKKDTKGEVVITRRDQNMLNQLAAELNSTYADGNRTESALEAIAQRINSEEKAQLEEQISVDYQDQFQWFLFPALVLFSLYLLLSPTVGKAKVSPRALALAAFLLGSAAASGQELQRYQEAMRAGHEAYSSGDFERALELFDSAAVAQPDSAEALYNVGNALQALGEYDKALEAYSNLQNRLQGSPAERSLLSDAFYNSGNVHFQQERYEEAVEAYKQSLRSGPNRSDALYNLSQAIRKRAQQQQEQQEEQQDQEQQDKEQPEDQQESDNKNDEKQEENQENQDQKKPEDQQDQSGEGDEGDQNREDQNNPDEGEPEEGKEKNEPKEGGEAKVQMTPEEIQGLLEAVQRAEQGTAEKVNAKNAKGTKKGGEKDW